MNTKQSMPNETHLQEGEAASEERLRAALSQAYPAMQPSPQLRARVAEMAAAHAVRAARQRTVRLRLRAGLGITGAAALLALMVVMWPRVVLAQVLRRMDAAMGGAQSVHIMAWRVNSDGSRTKESETWHRDGLWRMENWPIEETGQSRRVEVFADGKLWSYQPQFDRVTLKRQAGPSGQQPGGFTGTALIRTFTHASWHDKVSVQTENVQAEGRAARRVHIQTSGAIEVHDIVLLVDAATDLPIRAQIEVTSVYTGKHLNLLAEFRFDETLPATLFKPDFPKTAHLVDLDRDKEEWRQRLAKGIARRKVGDRTIVIRDLQVNAEGHAFLLYTAGKRRDDSFRGGTGYAGKDWAVDLTDEFGTEYERVIGVFQPAAGGDGNAQSNRPNGYSFNNERLEGDWWIPREAQQPWKPRRFTLTFRVNPTNLHGDWDGPVLKMSLSATTSFTLPVERPAVALVPDYMPYMFISLRAEDIQNAQADARGLLPPGVEESPQLIHTLLGNKHSVDALVFSPDGQTLASGAWKSGIKLWDARTGNLQKTLTTQLAFVPSLAFSSDGQTLISASNVYDGKKYTDDLLQLWSLKSGKAELTIKLPDSTTLRALALSPDGRTLTSAGTVATEKQGREIVSKMAAQVRSWDARSGKALRTRTVPHDGYILGLAPLPDGSAFVTSLQQRDKGITQGSLIRLWNVETDATRGTFEAPDRFEARHIVVSPDGNFVAASGTAYSGDTTTNTTIGTRVHLWDAQTGELLQTIREESPNVSPLAFSPDGKTLATAGDNIQKVKLWDVPTGRLLHSFTGHSRGILEFAFDSSGNRLASADWNGIIKLWRVK